MTSRGTPWVNGVGELSTDGDAEDGVVLDPSGQAVEVAKIREPGPLPISLGARLSTRLGLRRLSDVQDIASGWGARR